MTPASRRTAHLRMGGRLIMIAGIYIAGHGRAPLAAIPIIATYITGALIWDVLTDRQVGQLEAKAGRVDEIHAHWVEERAGRLASDAARADAVRRADHMENWAWQTMALDPHQEARAN